MVIESVEGRWDSLTARGEHFLGEIQLFLRQKRKGKERKKRVLQVQGQTCLGVGEMAHLLKAVLSTCAVWFTTVGGDCSFIPGRPDLSNYTETLLITRLFD